MTFRGGYPSKWATGLATITPSRHDFTYPLGVSRTVHQRPIPERTAQPVTSKKIKAEAIATKRSLRQSLGVSHDTTKTRQRRGLADEHTSSLAPAPPEPDPAPDDPATEPTDEYKRAWPKREAKWTKGAGYHRPVHFRAKAVAAIEDYIRDYRNPKSETMTDHDREVLAVMICELVPKFNPYFKVDRFLAGCGLSEFIKIKGGE